MDDGRGRVGRRVPGNCALQRPEPLVVAPSRCPSPGRRGMRTRRGPARRGPCMAWSRLCLLNLLRTWTTSPLASWSVMRTAWQADRRSATKLLGSSGMDSRPSRSTDAVLRRLAGASSGSDRSAGCWPSTCIRAGNRALTTTGLMGVLTAPSSRSLMLLVRSSTCRSMAAGWDGAGERAGPLAGRRVQQGLGGQALCLRGHRCSCHLTWVHL